ncbi:MAG TPA: hypothetical protein VGL99_07345 [Chloroflexota bacterium]
MAVPQLAVVGISLGLGMVGTATATDMISLREVAYALDLPLISGAVIMLREAMPGSVAHTLEPLAAIAGMSIVALPGVRWLRSILNSRLPRLAPATVSV